ncbi:hypothetical protein [[Clostridium] polysaccharolyticum]|uniref:Lipoprotein n=1 Tax=[Clostridium] polysaccharolyticum TaxID=29364 RepID=A0A1H9YVA1_9FIRM|nr:hypothetical protein [[Clostridium] polysaccharolyticum]SES73118.1 hypothetical protein SAMN04487772_102212 [[Clostridium] polysaccharolyticum]
MKRKIFSKKISILFVCLMAICLAGCAGKTDNGNANEPNATQNTDDNKDNPSDVAAGSESGAADNPSDGVKATDNPNGAGTAMTGTPQASKANPINDNITGFYSETAAYPLLESEIIDELDYENQDMSKTRYYYNYVDLDGDNIDEIIVQLNGEYNTTKDGDTVLIVKQTNADDDDDDDDGFDVIAQFTAFANPVIVSDNKTNGYRDLIFINPDSDPTTYKKVTYGKDGYGKMSDAKTIENLDNVTGVALLCNDIAADTQKEEGLFFAK